MNIDELKLILEAIGLITDDAKEFAYWWLTFRVFDSFLEFTCVITLIVSIYKFFIAITKD